MLALTQCWYTRKHVPDGPRHRADDGSVTSHCRHCTKKIVSWQKGSWYLADGFNVTRLAESTQRRFLYLLDIADDMIVARYPVGHLDSEEAIEEYKQQLREEHELDEKHGEYVLLDSINDG